MTLLEVTLAMSLMAAVLVVGIKVLISSIGTVAEISSITQAKQLAQNALESVRSVSPLQPTTGPSELVTGRTQAAVAGAWQAAAAQGLDISDTYTGSGATSYDAHTYGGSGTAAVPISQQVRLGATDFDVVTLIGTCTRLRTAVDCVRGASGQEIFRVVVMVSWQSRTANPTCRQGRCSFVLSTLIDPNADPAFTLNRPPLANPDAANTLNGTPVIISVTANDSAAINTLGAVTVTTTPLHGVATVVAGTNTVRYLPTVGFTGTDRFVYRLTDSQGRISNSATVSVSIP